MSNNFDPNRHVPMGQFNGQGKNCYSDYEELAFMNGAAPWVSWLFESVKDIGGAFARDCQGYQNTSDRQRQDFMDTVFFSAVHVCSAYYDADEEHFKSRKDVDNIVEAVCYTVQLLSGNDYIVQSGVDWISDPNPYVTYIEGNQP